MRILTNFLAVTGDSFVLGLLDSVILAGKKPDESY